MQQLKLLRQLRFNPCFIGSISEALVITFWLGGRQICFNPCFIGSISEAMIEGDLILLDNTFQSLFYWKYL